MKCWIASALGVAILATSAASQPDLAKKVQRIEKACKLRRGTITAVKDEVHFTPTADESYDSVDCALKQLKAEHVEKLGFVGNEVDPDRPLPRPWSYIAGGRIEALTTLAEEARKAGWVVGSIAKADDGTGFITFHTPEGMTEAQAGRFADRLWEHELGDITWSNAPTYNGGVYEGD